MKKIGLAVCYDTNNFGSQLQVLATIKEIENLGYNPEIIRYEKKFSPEFILQQIPRLFNGSFIEGKLKGFAKKRKISKDIEVKRNLDIRSKRFKAFREQYFIGISQRYAGWNELVTKTEKNYDTLLCGSDQLWLPSNLESHFYTLEFAKQKAKKISYATSFGVSYIPENQKKRTARYLKDFDYLSTREIKGQEIIKTLSNKDAKVVCDPTLLFTAEQWNEILPNEKIIPEKYIFCYYLGENAEHREAANILKNKTNYKIVTIPFLDNYVEIDKKFGDVQLYDVDSKDFVNLIRNAEYVLTDSFHGTVFSILNHKKFITFNRFSGGKGSRNSRIDSLCTLLGLNDRRFNKDICSEVDREIDYTNIDKKLKEFRNDSIEFLKDALK